jgi:hypothetical protein
MLNFVEAQENFDEQNKELAQYSSFTEFWNKGAEMGGWMDGCNISFKDCLQQLKIPCFSSPVARTLYQTKLQKTPGPNSQDCIS